jgi:hypothetical protein
MTMADLEPQDSVVVYPNDDEGREKKMVDDAETMTCGGGSDSPGGVDGLEPTATDGIADECKLVESGSASEVEGEDDDDVIDDEEEEEEEDENNKNGAPEIESTELSAEALLALSKSRLDEVPQPQNAMNEGKLKDNEKAEEDVDTPVASSEENANMSTKVDSNSPAKATLDEPGIVKDQAYFIELAMKKAKESKVISSPTNDNKHEDPTYLHKLAEKKVAEAEAKAKADEEKTGEHVIKPVLLPAKPTRNENSELWALLNYSKARLETGATPHVGGGGSGKKASGSSRGSSIRGDDTMSVSSKLSRSSKRSQSSRLTTTGASVTVVGGPDDAKMGEGDGPFPDVTDNGDVASVDGSVSLESATKNYSDANDDDDDDDDEEEESDNSDEEEGDDDSSEGEEEEDDLPDFLKNNDDEEIDPEEARELYEAAKFKAASILSVTKDNLTDVQMLQAIAIAEDAAKNGEEKFSTKRSLFKLNEAKVEDLKSLLSLSFAQTSSTTEQDGVTPKERERYTGGWGIGGGRLIKKLGTVAQDFREKCNEIDAKKEKARVGQPTGKDMLNAAMLDLRTQIEELYPKREGDNDKV